jgi:hypothetical protein
VTAPPAEQALIELEELLADQLARAREGRPDGVAGLAERIDELLAIAGSAGADARLAERARRVGRLYDQLCLALAARKQQLGDRLARLRLGKNVLKAYRFGAEAG